MLQINRVRRESFTPTHQDRYSGGIWNKVCVPVRIKPSIFGGVMRNAWILAGIAAWLLGAGIPQAQAQSTAARRPIVREIKGPERKGGLDVYHIDSDYQASPASLYVLLPDRLDPAKRYKVLYVLPAWGPSNDGILEARKLNLANKYDVICVGPDYVDMCWYADNPERPGMLYDSYLPEVVVPWIDKTYPTITAPEGRILVGFSKSGVGAVSELLRHPEVFGRAGSWDAPLTEDHTRPEYYGPQEYFMENYYIPGILARQADTLRRQPACIAIIGFGFGGTPPAHALMQNLGIPHYYDDSVRPAHEWSSGWLEPLVNVLMAPDMAKVGPIGPMTTPLGSSAVSRATTRPARKD